MSRKTDPWIRALHKAVRDRASELDLLREHDLKANATRSARS